MLFKKVSLILLAVLLSACAGGSVPAAKVTVNMTEFAFTPNVINVSAGQPVELTLINDGAVEHDFVVEIIPVDDVVVEGEGVGDHHMASEDHSEFDLHSSTTAGGTSTLRFTVTEPGTYKIICSVPGHLDAGMVGELIVE